MRAIDEAQDKILQDVISGKCPSDYGIETGQSLKCYVEYEGNTYIVKYYFHFGMYMFENTKTGGGSTGMTLPIYECVVVGNIHENPELLS